MKCTLMICLLMMLVIVGFSQDDSIRKKLFNLDDGIALDGYDAVSYFNKNPIEGKKQFRYTYRGITYYFVNNDNLQKFQSNPQQYEPAYGGWCAYAMGKTGEKVKVDPETYKIIEGRLYLFYNFWGNNTLNDWNEKEKPLKTTADSNWKKLFQ